MTAAQTSWAPLFGTRMNATDYESKRRIGIVPQDVAVFDELTVRENIDAFCALYLYAAFFRLSLLIELR